MRFDESGGWGWVSSCKCTLFTARKTENWLNDKRSPSFRMFSLLVCCDVCVCVRSFEEGAFEPMNLFHALVRFGDRRCGNKTVHIKCDMWVMTGFFLSVFSSATKIPQEMPIDIHAGIQLNVTFLRGQLAFFMVVPTATLEFSNKKIAINRFAYARQGKFNQWMKINLGLVLVFDHINYCDFQLFPADHSTCYTPMAANAFMRNCSYRRVSFIRATTSMFVALHSRP